MLTDNEICETFYYKVLWQLWLCVTTFFIIYFAGRKGLLHSSCFYPELAGSATLYSSGFQKCLLRCATDTGTVCRRRPIPQDTNEQPAAIRTSIKNTTVVFCWIFDSSFLQITGSMGIRAHHNLMHQIPMPLPLSHLAGVILLSNTNRII